MFRVSLTSLSSLLRMAEQWQQAGWLLVHANGLTPTASIDYCGIMDHSENEKNEGGLEL